MSSSSSTPSLIVSHARVLSGSEVKAHHRAIAAEKKRKKNEESNQEIQEKKRIEEEAEREKKKQEKKEKRKQRRLVEAAEEKNNKISSKNDATVTDNDTKSSKKSKKDPNAEDEPKRKKHKSKSDTDERSNDAVVDETVLSSEKDVMETEPLSISSSSKPQINAAVEALSVLAVNDDDADQLAMELERKQQKQEKKSSVSNTNASNKPLWMIRGQSIDSETRIPITNYSLHSDTLRILRSHSIESFFATQSTVIPMVLNSHGVHDICVAAPTGSGKTLSYVIPIIERLRLMVIRRLRVLVVVPTRDLALQVKSVFDWFCPSFGLKCEVAIGQTSFALEQAKIIKYSSTGLSSGASSSINYSNHSPFFHSSDHTNNNLIAESLIDILICTPGRLMDHLHSTPGFSLQSVQWLVIDEVDRLLTQHYHDWIAKILQAIYTTNTVATDKDDDNNNDSLSITDPKNNASINNNGPHGWMQIIDSSTRYRYANRDHLQEPLQKLLFSATLTTNPAKLSSLDLRHPLFFSETSNYKKQYKIPPSLRQRVIRCETGNKPLVLIYLLQMILFNLQKSNNNNAMETEGEGVAKTDQEPYGGAHQVIIFTSSLQSTHRLYRLLELYSLSLSNPSLSKSSSNSSRLLSEYSSSLSQSVRSSLLFSFRLGQLRVLICSDIMARGIDLPSVDAVINYDVPVYIKTYIHRVGRTARAGKGGWAYSLCRKEDQHHFYSILKAAENSYLLPITIDQDQLEPFVPRFIQCLDALKKILNEELGGKLVANAPLPSNRIPMIEGNNNDNNSKGGKTNKKDNKNNALNKKALIEAEAMIEEEGEESNNNKDVKSKSIKKKAARERKKST